MERAVVLAAILAAAGGSVEYCGARMCARSNAHTFCQYPPGPGPRCAGYTEDRLSSEEKARVLARLNRRRSEAARGLLRQLPSASNMLKLRWVEELSREAQLWADQCAPPGVPEEHDACRDLYSISVGQCVASVVGEAPGLRAESMVDTWYLQGLHYKGNISYTMNTERYDMDFAQMLWAHTYLVGCARSRFMSEVNGRMRTVTRLVCNQAPRAPAAGALWLPGAPAAACPPRARRAAAPAALCEYHDDTGDLYDVSNEMTQQEQIVLNAVLKLERNQSLDHHGSLDEIYLTNMAIATLSQPAFTQSYLNSMQKRDIVEPIYLEEEETVVADTKVNVIDDVIAKLVQEKTTTKKPEVITKANIVGRPKSYRIDELDEPTDKDVNCKWNEVDVNSANVETDEIDADEIVADDKTRPVETTTVTESDAYVEYEFQEIPEKREVEENVTENELKSSSSTIALNPTVTENATEMESSTTQLTLNPAIENFTLEANVTNDALRKLLELSKKSEEYPSDPETARELQEALERLEMTLADETPAKVRRELKRPSPEQYLEDPPDRVTQHHQTSNPLPEEIMKNNSVAKPPMLDMMFKYLPFMRNYQKTVTGTSAAGSTQIDFWLVYVKISLFCTFNL